MALLPNKTPCLSVGLGLTCLPSELNAHLHGVFVLVFSTEAQGF
jgi:hypothetical protein